jgi:hypothetical protein
MTVTLFNDPVQMYRNNQTSIDVVIDDEQGNEIDYSKHIWRCSWRLTENSPTFLPAIVNATKDGLTITFTSAQTAMMNGSGVLDLLSEDTDGIHYWFKTPTEWVESVTV